MLFSGDQWLKLKSRPDAKSAFAVRFDSLAGAKNPPKAEISGESTVRESCTEAGWSRVEMVSPSFFARGVAGWIQTSKLIAEPRDVDGKRRYFYGDVVWTQVTEPHNREIIMGINRLHREDPRCQVIDPASVFVVRVVDIWKGERYGVDCGTGDQKVSVIFSKKDVLYSPSMVMPDG